MTTTNEADGLLRFLVADIPEDDLRTTLRVLQTFKGFESTQEWMMPFDLWARLEQLEDYLRIRLNVEVDEVDDERAKEYYENLKG